jgi:hypothetical protein
LERSLYIRVLDANDNAPVFLQAVYYSGLALNSTPGALIANVQATDKDIGVNAEIKYGLLDGGEGTIAVNQVNGTVYLNALMDLGAYRDWLNFTIYAQDNGEPEMVGHAVVAVQLFDEKELVPHFTSTVFAFSVAENQAVGTVAGAVQLLNPTFPNFKPFRFSIVNAKPVADPVFSIDATSGAISTLKVIDREEKDTFNVQVNAALATNEEAINSMATVTIRITDENDQLPYFIFPSRSNNTIYITPDIMPSHIIATVAAKDADTGPNAQLTFSVFAGDPLDYFSLDGRTGNLVLQQDLRSVDPQKFALTIKVEDNGEPKLSEEATLNIILQNSSTLNTKLAIYLGLAFGAGLLLLALVIAICVVLRKQKKSARKCKKVEKMLDEKIKSLESLSNHHLNLSQSSSEMEAQRVGGFLREDKRSSYSQVSQVLS